MTENNLTVRATRDGGLLIGKSSVAVDDIKMPATATVAGAGFGDQITDEDRKFASEREPIGILLTYGMAADITEKWFSINDPDTEEADPALDRVVQDALAMMQYKTKLTWAIEQRRIYGWSMLVGGFIDAKKPQDLKNPLRVGSELKQLSVYDKTNVRIVEYDRDEMSPRFGQPVIYELNRGNGVLTEIHYTRVCTVPTDISRTRSVLDGVWDDMTCGRNIRWGVAQYIHRVGSGFPVIEFPEGTTVEQMAAWDSNFRDLMCRTHISIAQNSPIANTGMKFHFEGAASAVIDPTNFFRTNDEQISKASGIPQPSLVGAQAGAVTGSEVNMQSKYKVVSRDQQELEDVNRWVIDRLAESGQIGLVTSSASTATDKLKQLFGKVFGSDYRHKTARTYTIEWNSAFELSEKDKALIEVQHTQSCTNKLGYMSKDEVRAEEGLDPLPDGAGEWKDAPDFGGEEFLVKSKQGMKPNAKPNSEEKPTDNPDDKGS